MNHAATTTTPTTTAPTTEARADAAPPDLTPRTVRRRGLVAGAAVLVAAALAAQPVGAVQQLVGTNGMWNGAPDGNADGVQGYTTGVSNAGVFGRNNDLNGIGVAGAAPSGIGVAGSSGNGAGVSGVSASGPGAVGISTSSNGVFGQTDTGVGVWAVATKPGGLGLLAYSSATTNPKGAQFGGLITGNQVQMVMDGSNGAGQTITAYSNTVGYPAVWGLANATSATGIAGSAGAGGHAGIFSGDVTVTGSFVVNGSKNAAVPHPDGTYRLLYCTEAPEPWFEDFGTATLTAGKATVTLDPDFAAVIVTSGYHVFLTPYGDCNGLVVTNRTATGFTVQEGKGGTSTLSFSWRVVARRKDIAGDRLKVFTPPLLGPTPTPPPAPPELANMTALPPAPAATPVTPPPPVAPVLTGQTATVTPMTSSAATLATSTPTATTPAKPGAPTGTAVSTTTAGNTATAASGPTSTSASSSTSAAAPVMKPTATGSPAITPTVRPAGTASATGDAVPNVAPPRH